MRQRPGDQPLLDFGVAYKWYSQPPVLPELDDEGFDRNEPTVVVVGAGPVGLTIAMRLARAGVSTLVLEADETVCRSSKANGVSQRTFETMDRVAPGLGEELARRSEPTAGSDLYFGHRQILEQVPATKEQTGGKYEPASYLAQWYIEDGLVRALSDRDSAQLRWQSRVHGVEVTPDQAVLDVTTPLGDYRVRTSWVVAADGGRSAVRSARGLRMTGGEYGSAFIIVDAIIRGDKPPANRRVWFDPEYLRGGLTIRHLPPEQLWRFDFQLPIGTELAEGERDAWAERAIRAHLADVGYEAEDIRSIWIGTYRPRALSLEDFRDGRILFAGDAAHLMPFFGGFGMNAGIDDADNLGWKLAMVVRGEATEDLLNTYAEERVPAIRASLAIQSRSAEFLIPSSEASEHLRRAALTLAAEGNRLAAGLGRHRVNRPMPYEDSSICVPDGDAFATGPPPGAPIERGWVLVGDQPAYLHDLLGGRFCFLVFGEAAGTAALLEDLAATADASSTEVGIVRLGPAAAGLTSPLATDAVDANGALTALFGARSGTTYLVRPDGVVAARHRAPTAVQLAEALERATGQAHGAGVTERGSAAAR